MNRRRRHDEEHTSHERWLVSYADFITLLFAFFVVMYSISSINEGKYRVLSESLNEIFSDPKGHPVPQRAAEPIQIGEIKRSPDIHEEMPPASPDVVDLKNGQLRDEQTQLANAAEQIERVLAPYIQEDLIAVKKEGNWIEVEMKSGLLFGSGSADLAPAAIPIIEKLADIFAPLESLINVEGHTDDKPINTAQFPSNWELSSARAASVVHQLMRSGLDPVRMAAIGYGEYHPVTDNLTEEGRYKNRRVVLILQAKAFSRFQSHDETRPLASATASAGEKPTQPQAPLPPPNPLPPGR
ncbi:flagellar motor protein MotD [Methylococcus sp. EFPC2]|uniref:flagellar motor protein MotD n=1 Tax=Methylococcus sp. EFPC2 TaxID=2812648 RepID=UPI0019675B82|nr:flagellar motor protein MotD [Methylococcus sp. EFPC2]QSA98885.1 flagellar motor protein MotD [Methylococcus sp. EFPC2]